MRLPFAIALLALAGCASQEQRIATDDAQCLSYGVPRGSAPYVACRMRQDELRAAKQSAIISGGGMPSVIVGATTTR